MRTLALTFFLFSALLPLSPPSEAAVLQGVNMPDKVSAAGKELVLNGMGMREATIFKVKVYVAGLYVQKTSKSAQAIIESPEIKRVEMRFLRNVGADKIREAWSDGVKKNCQAPTFQPTECQAFQSSVAKLSAATQDFKEGDTMSFTFLPEKLEAKIKGNDPVVFEQPGFSKVILMVWLGKEPPNESLKEGMLGIKKD